jgi:Cof subfamily protein (haloacid dehalogenase superfamily)
MHIRCILMDIDGTLLDRNWLLPPRTAQALGRAAEAGITLALATGRPLCALPDVLKSFKGIDYAITSNGAAISRLPSGGRIYSQTLPPSAADEALGVLARPLAAGLTACEAAVDGRIYCTREYFDSPQRFGAFGRNADYVRATRIPLDDTARFIRENRASLYCVNAVPLPEYKGTLLTALRRGVKGVTVNAGGRLIELADERCGKEKAAQRLLEALGISPRETAAFGDGDSDAAMLGAVYAGVAVGTASEKCAAAARWRAPEGAERTADWIAALALNELPQGVC